MRFYYLLIPFILSLLAIVSLMAMAFVPLCHSSIIVDWHHPDGHKAWIEIHDDTDPRPAFPDNMADSGLETGQAGNSTLTLTGGKLAGDVDFPGVGNGGFFYSPPPPWGGGGGKPSGLFDIDLVILQPIISWLMSIGKHSVSFEWQLSYLKQFLEHTALKTHYADHSEAGNVDGKPSGEAPDNQPEGENNHDQEQSDESEGQENPPPEENGKDDNGEGAGNSPSPSATTQNLQELANRLIAIIERNNRLAAFKLKDILNGLDMPQRLQVLETTGTNFEGRPVTPLEAVLELRRVSKDNSIRNLFIKQLILATSGVRKPFNSPDIWSELQHITPTDHRVMPEAGNNNLRILSRIVLDIIDKANLSDQHPPIIRFERSCFNEYFIRLFLTYSNPLKLIHNLLEEIPDVAIRCDVFMVAPSLTFPARFLDNFIHFYQHPSFHELQDFKNKLWNKLADLASLPDSDHNASGSVSESADPANDRYLQQGAKPKQLTRANGSNLTQPTLNEQLAALIVENERLSNDNQRLAADNEWLRNSRKSLKAQNYHLTEQLANIQQMPVASPPIPDSGTMDRLDHQETGSNEQVARQPVQETPKPLCDHYHRLCRVRFKCCETFFPCHRCHNEKVDGNEIACKTNGLNAKDATMLKCSLCDYEGEINESSQTCPNCNKQMSEYYCSICKQFTSLAKDPHHCDKCGICRIHRDRSFHCDTCNACLDKKLKDNHSCQPGHSECSICLEDTFSGCQILPCSHKVHRECAIAMIQNGIRTCPVCRAPLFSGDNND
ncbi:CHY zinc finger protein [Endozoicomonas sp. 4G]|uniref:CHY zinc finger protein n=1 Tax=Endozoicomonas sp. 4G TaxID=2872754 RepID=UPI002078E846|nr:CHY zinc finger protein [Endozoicomonas sp. 4G]